jgi:pimeloyl-ACP methyl ester carboxylesterase
MVFDYSGFGASSGSPTVENLRQDAVAAMAHWIELTPEASKRVMIGHSLGNAVMLEAAKSMQKPLPMVIHAGFTSAREIAVETGLLHPMLSSLLAPWLPDLWNNEQTLSALNSKVLIVHGDRDEVVPPDMATRLARAAGDKARLQIQPGVGHDDIFLQASDADWGPVVQWALEATQEDTTVRNSSSP